MKHMQCPHCYKTDLHPKATRCHHCGGEIEHESGSTKAVWGLILGAVAASGILILVWGKGGAEPGLRTATIISAVILFGAIVGASIGGSMDE